MPNEHLSKKINLDHEIEFLASVIVRAVIQQQENNDVDNNNKISIEDKVDRITSNHKKEKIKVMLKGFIAS